ncbi:MAG: hypothetical protein ACOYED_08445 [Peptococcia bacterium]|jgi:cell division protein FtsB
MFDFLQVSIIKKAKQQFLPVLLLLLSFMLLIAGCAWQDDDEIEVENPVVSKTVFEESLENENIELKQRIQTLEQEIANLSQGNIENESLKNENTELKQKIQTLEQEIEDLPQWNIFDKENSKVSSIYFLPYTVETKLVPEETKLHIYPQKEAIHLRTIPENTIVTVVNAGYTDEDGTWLYVYAPMLIDSMQDFYGWIPEGAVVAYTEENQKLAERIITVKKGTKVYDVTKYEFKDIPKATPMELNSDTNGEIVERKEGYVRLECLGLFSCWVEEKDLVYPETS